MESTTLDIDIGINSQEVLAELKKITASISTLGVSTNTSTAKIDTGIKEATKSINNLGGVANTTAGKVVGGFKSMLGATLAMGIALTSIQSIFGFQKQAIDVKNLSDNLGISTERISKFHQAISDTGGSSSAIDSTLQSLNKSQLEFKQFGQGSFKEVQSKYGVSVGGNADEQLLKVADRMKGLSASKQIDLASMLGIDTQLLPLLRKGRTEIEAILATKTNGLISEKDAKNALAMQKSLGQIKANFAEIGKSILTLLAPALEKISNGVRWFFGLFAEYEGLAVASIVAIGVALLPVAGILAGMAIKAIILYAPFILIGTAIAGIIALMQELWVWFKGGDSIINQWFSFNDVIIAVGKGLECIQNIMKSIGSGIGAGFDFVLNMVGLGDNNKTPLPPSISNSASITNNVSASVDARGLSAGQAQQAVTSGITESLVNNATNTGGF